MPLNSQSLDRILSAETTVSATITSNTAFTLPSAANMAGKLYTIYNPSASTANVLVNAADASLVVTVQPGSAAVVTPISDVPATNAAWMVVTNGVNASGVKGRTDGSAIAAGYVGERITASLAGITQASPTINNWYDDSGTLSLTAGTWTIYNGVSLYGSNPGSISGGTVPQIIGGLRTGSTLLNQMVAAEGQVNGQAFCGVATNIQTVSISSTTVYKQSALFSNRAGSPTLATLGTFAGFGYLYAVRIA